MGGFEDRADATYSTDGKVSNAPASRTQPPQAGRPAVHGRNSCLARSDRGWPTIQSMEPDRPAARLGIIAALAAAGGWIAYSGSIPLVHGLEVAALSAFLSAWSGLVIAFAWPQLRQPDPARRSTLVLILSASMAIGLASTYPLVTANDMASGMRWLGAAAAATAAVPLALILWRRSVD